MKKEEYISSGVLELYVMGSLSPREEVEVEEMAAKYPEIKEELSKIEASMEQYAFAHARKVPEGMKEKFFSKFDKKEKKSPSMKVVTNKVDGNTGFAPKWLVAASVTLAILTSVASVYLWSKLQAVEKELGVIKLANQQLAESFDQTNNELQSTKNYLSILKNNSTQFIQLKGLEIAPESEAIVYWDKSSGDVFLNIRQLPLPPEGMQYQLWALKDGQPIDAGVFETNSEIQKMKKIVGSDAFAVTLEKAGGSPVPNLDALYLMGKLES
ncbi:anti-sigma factor [Flexithrix dorotheae]|uniref:anti-sigma factor n=1 Tax=Flexithrix dorotheae TaxID=70993 RepID=UPI000374B8D8|nr:anti-sigma factor [Flexithrix dorotheae]